MVGAIESKNVYRKRNTCTRDIEVIKTHLAGAREAVVNKADEPIENDNIKLGVDDKYNQDI